METEIKNNIKESYKVSVIIPSYNHAPYLRKRIDSVLDQSYDDFEVIILDDKSTDNSKEIIETYRGNPKISHIVYNELNSGSTFKQWNKGVELASGKYIWIAESDDYSDSSLLSVLVDLLDNNPSVAIVYSQSYRVDAKGEVQGDWLFHTKTKNGNFFSSDFIMNGRKFIVDHLAFKNVIPNASAVLFNKAYFTKIGGADENIKYCSDWLSWLKILLYGDIAYSSQKLNYFRYHDTSVIAKAVKLEAKNINNADSIMRITYDKYLREVDNSENIIRTNKKFLKKEYKRNIRRAFKRGYFITAFKNTIFAVKTLRQL